MAPAIRHITSAQGKFQSVKLSPAELRISSSHISNTSGVLHVYLQQMHNDIDIKGAVASVHYSDSDELLYDNNQLYLQSLKNLKNAAKIDAVTAIAKAAAYHGLSSKHTGETISSSAKASKKSVLRNSDLSASDIPARLIYLPTQDGLALSWEVYLEHPESHHMWHTYVDAQNGQVLQNKSLTLECHFPHKKCTHSHHTISTANHSVSAFAPNSYNVFAIPLEAPNEGSRSVEVAPWNDALNASPFGWHDTNGIAGAEYTITRGNNVYASEDQDANNSPGASPDGGAMLMFDFPIDFTQEPEMYLDASTTQLFYMNNIVHDVLYQYGFDEAAGNFQFNNYGKGGDGSDEVLADALDGSSTNNATFGTPPDGFSPRMTMFRFTGSVPPTFDVNAPASVAGSYAALLAQFGPQQTNITGDVIVADQSQACNATPITNGAAIDGNIALIDRGACTFVEKINNAQSAGAIAAIVCNNVETAIFNMGGTDGSITIPSIMISKSDCDNIRNEAGLNVTIMAEESPSRDSDLDNGIMAHEYGHGLSNRLTGGRNNVGCLDTEEQMGEGWSDFLSLLFQLKPGDQGTDANGIGSYVQFEPETGGGIRPFPYSTDMSVNPMTYNTISSVSVPHGVGSVWCTMLWDMTWNLIEKEGYDADIYSGNGGNGIALKLVLEGMKLQPCSLGFVDGRDAILAADQALYGGAYRCEIWRAFAKRGLGEGASQGDYDNLSDGVESYVVPGCEPCTSEDLVIANTNIPDNTEEYVNGTATLTNTTLGASETALIQATDQIEIQPELEIVLTAELTLSIAPCIVSTGAFRLSHKEILKRLEKKE